MKDRCKPWGTVWGIIISFLIIASVCCAAVAFAVHYGFYGKNVILTDDLEIVGANVNQDETHATATMRLDIKDGKRLVSYDKRVEGDCLFLTLYSALKGGYDVDDSGVTTFSIKTDKSINYIRMEAEGKKKDLVRITWNTEVSAKGITCTDSKLSAKKLELSLKLPDKKGYLSGYESRRDGDKLYLTFNSAPIITDYKPDNKGIYKITLELDETVKSVWAESTQIKAEAKLCDVSWPSVVQSNVSIGTPSITFDNTTAVVSIEVTLTESDRFVWSYDSEIKDGIMDLILYDNATKGGYNKGDNGAFTVIFDIDNSVNEVRLRYADGSVSPICTVEWPKVVGLSDIETNGPMSPLYGTFDIALDFKLPEGLYYYGSDVQYKDGTAFVTLYSSKMMTDKVPSESGFYRLAMEHKADINFVVLTDGTNEEIIYRSDASRLLGDGDITLVSHSVTNSKITLKIKVEKKDFFFKHAGSVNDGKRLVVSFYGSAAEGDLKPDADGCYTVTLDLPETATTVIQEVDGNEKTIIENIYG